MKSYFKNKLLFNQNSYSNNYSFSKSQIAENVFDHIRTKTFYLYSLLTFKFPVSLFISVVVFMVFLKGFHQV